MSVIEFPTKKLNKKKLIIFISIFSLACIFLIGSIIYAFNSSFREFIDIYFFRKKINSENLHTIEISSNEDKYFHAYDKYIVILSKKVLSIYNNLGEICEKNDLNISVPIFSNNNKFLAIGENNGNNLCLISGTKLIWQTKVSGNISKINVNKNGYVSVIVSGTNYKSVVISFDSKGKELFKTYLSTNIAIDTDISNDNKYLSIAEIDYSGSIIKSMIKNISIEKAKTDPTNSVIYNYILKENSLLTNIKYQDKNKLICMCTDSSFSFDMSDFSTTELLKYQNYEYVDIYLKNNLLYTTNNSFGFSNTANVNILNINNNSINTYKFKGSIKSLSSNLEKIAINTGSEVHFIGLNGWLIKKYESYNEINNIVLGNSVAGIIHKDKIEIINI